MVMMVYLKIIINQNTKYELLQLLVTFFFFCVFVFFFFFLLFLETIGRKEPGVEKDPAKNRSKMLGH
jgi:hypothetical protein